MRTLPPEARAGRVLVLDPAQARCGISLYHGERLLEAQTIRGVNPADIVAYQLARYIEWADSIVIEVPKTRKKAQGIDRSLRGLREMVKLVRKAAKKSGTPVLGLKPEQWKGNVPKEITAARALALLSDGEKEMIKDDSDDTTDAIGLGLVALSRAKRGVAS